MKSVFNCITEHALPLAVSNEHHNLTLKYHVSERVSFYSVNKYFAISAETLTKALKPELQNKAARRYITEVKAQYIKNGEVEKAIDLTTGKELTL